MFSQEDTWHVCGHRLELCKPVPTYIHRYLYNCFFKIHKSYKHFFPRGKPIWAYFHHMWSKAFGVDFWCFSFRTWGITEVPSIKGSLSWSLMSFQGVFLCWVNIWTHYTARLHFCWEENQLELEPLPGCLKQLPRYSCPAWWPCKPFSPWMRSGLHVPLMLTFSLSQSHPPARATSRSRIAKSPQTLLLPTDAGSHKDPSEKEQGYQIYFFCVWASWPVDWLPGFLLVLHIEVHPWLESSLGRK